MKLLARVLAVGLALLWTAGAVAAERQDYRHRTKPKPAHQRVHQKNAAGFAYANRCGLRNHGTPVTSLDLSNACDQDEFWRRLQDRGGEGR